MHTAPHRFRGLLRSAALAALGALLITALPGQPVSAAATLTNPGFESGTSGWSTYSAVGRHAASYTEAGGHSGSNRLSH